MEDYWRERLKFLRKRAGMTQAGLSDKSRVSQSLIANLENGKRNFTQKSLSDILTALECNYHDLFAISDAKQEASMSGNDDMGICKKMGISAMDWHELLSKMERLDARELNLVAM